MLSPAQTLTEQVAGALIDAIGRGVYAVGAKLPPGRLLARQYGVSAAVIREATERLRAQGLVRSRQGSGCVVMARTGTQGFQVALEGGLDRAELLSVYELRMELEAGAAALAAQRRSAADVDALEQAFDTLGLHLDDPVLGDEHDVAFHLAIARATHNDHYQRLLQYLHVQLRQAVSAARANTASQPGLAQRVHDEHHAILDAIRTGQADVARRAALCHLRNACTRLELGINFSS